MPQLLEYNNFNPLIPHGSDGNPEALAQQVKHSNLLTLHGRIHLVDCIVRNRHISIHPPRARWDQHTACCPPACRYFNPPTPCGVGPPAAGGSPASTAFQSTHPVRGGTSACSRSLTNNQGFNPPTPCGVGPAASSTGMAWPNSFNPPTPCGVGPTWRNSSRPPRTFQSTHPVRGGTQPASHSSAGTAVSIHPPRAGWDNMPGPWAFRPLGFNPPTPCGVGLQAVVLYQSIICRFNPPTPCGVGPGVYSIRCAPGAFQSTHPVRGGTVVVQVAPPPRAVSIHPPRAGWDAGSVAIASLPWK